MTKKDTEQARVQMEQIAKIKAFMGLGRSSAEGLDAFVRLNDPLIKLRTQR